VTTVRGPDDAIADLGHHDPGRRHHAREYLVGQGAAVLPAVQAAMERVPLRTAALYRELERVRDWIRFGDDPEKLERLIQELDPRSFEHGNMRGGAYGAILDRPAYTRVVEQPERVRRFFEAIVGDTSEAYARRAVAAIGLKPAGSAETVPILLTALDSEHAALGPDERDDLVEVREDYRGLFLHAACDALGGHTGETFDPGLHEALEGLSPTTVVSRGMLGEAVRGWRRWCEVSPALEAADAEADAPAVERLLDDVAAAPVPAESPALFRLHRLGARAEPAVAAFLLNAPRVDEVVLAVADTLFRNGRGGGIPEGDRAVAIVGGLLLRRRDVVRVRRLTLTCHDALPVSTLRAAASVVAEHPLAAEARSVLNPYAILGLELGRPGRAPIAEAALHAIVAGFASGGPVQRAFYLDVLESVLGREPAPGLTALEACLSRLATDPSASSAERLRIIAMRTRRGARPPLDAVRSLLRDAIAGNDAGALQDVLQILEGAEVPRDARAAWIEELLPFTGGNPGLQESLLRCLSRLAPDDFPFSPVIGPEALQALVEIYRIRAAAPATPDPQALSGALARLRAGVIKGMQDSAYGPPAGTILADRVLAWGTNLADRFGLTDELYQSLGLRAGLVGTGSEVRLQDAEAVRDGVPESLTASSEYLRAIVPSADGYSSLDASALLFEAAAAVAAGQGHHDERWLAPALAAADMARKARRHAESERRFRALDAHVAGNLLHAANQKHFLCLLLLEQERWADALETTGALRDLFREVTEPLSPDLEHCRLDADLHEMRCRRQRGEYAEVFRGAEATMQRYHAIGHGTHFVDVLIETAATSALQGDAASAESCFELAHRFVREHPQFEEALPSVLREEAAFRLRAGAPEEAESVVRAAITARGAVPAHTLEGAERDPLAADLALLGRAQVEQGKIHDARETVARLSRMNESAAYALHRARLEALVHAATGSIASAIDTLRQAAQTPGVSTFPDLVVELRLDLAGLLAGQGFAGEALHVLDEAHAIAAAARNPRTTGRVRLLQARIHEGRSDVAAAEQIYRALHDPGARGDDASDTDRLAALGLLWLAGRADPASVDDADDVVRRIHEIGEAAERVEQLLRFGRLYVDGSRLAQAARLVAELDGLTARGARLAVQLELAMLRGRLARATGDDAMAVTHFRNAVHVTEVVHAAGVEKGIGTGFLSALDEPYVALIDALAAGGHAAEALHYAERARTRLLVDQMHWRRGADAQADPTLDRYLTILQRLAFLELAAGPDADGAHATERAALETELEGLRAGVSERALTAVVYPSFGTPEHTLEIIRALLGRGGEPAGPVVLAEYMVTEQSVLLFLMRADLAEPLVVRIERSARDVAELVSRGVQANTFDDADAFRAFAAPLVAPLLEPPGDPVAAEGAVICFAPHAGLHYLPLHALDVGGRPLIERNPIVYVPGATLMHQRTPRPRRPLARALVVGDPAGDLPYARDEAIVVGELFGTRPWLGAEATRSRVLDALRAPEGRPDLVHLGCHGFFDAARPMRSGIQLAPEAGGSEADATLTVRDIFELELNGALVTLSACETGISQQRPGDELVGLTRALLLAGAASVVVSLWAVDDDSSALLMEAYYEGLRAGASRAEALRAAQARVRGLAVSPAHAGDERVRRHALPSHWAPFILVGDWA
jgi:CHAT domain-containing protein